MRILHLSTTDNTGGAARAAFRLHRGLCAAGADSRMYVAEKKSDDERVTRFEKTQTLAAKTGRFIRNRRDRQALKAYDSSRPTGFEIFTTGHSHYADEPFDAMPEADVYHLHWFTHFLDYALLFKKLAASGKPVVWTLHDMNGFTGGCHFDNGCGRFVSECGRCPQLGSENEKDLSRQIWAMKKKAYAHLKPGQLTLAAPSVWMATEASGSGLLKGVPVKVIPYGLDTDLFSPRNKRFSREVFGLPPDNLTVLFVADSVTNRRKGFSLLLDALHGLDVGRPVTLAALGGGEIPALPELEAKGIRIARLGQVSDDRLLPLAYSAADLFVIPSLQDNLPNTVLEALACGVPVAGFDAGGIPDMVRPGINGWLAKTGESSELREVIRTALGDDETRAQMGINARHSALEHHTLAKQARAYLDLYASLT